MKSIMFVVGLDHFIDSQRESAKQMLDIDQFVYMPGNLLLYWKDIPTMLDDLTHYLAPIRDWCDKQITTARELEAVPVFCVIGHPTACYNIVNYLRKKDVECYYPVTYVSQNGKRYHRTWRRYS